MNTEIYHPDSNRLGKIRITYETLRDGAERPMLRALFALCDKIDEYEDESGRGHEFILASDLFQPLTEGEEIPQYRIESVHNKPFPEADDEARRLNAGDFGFVAIRQILIRVPPATVLMQPRITH